MIDDLDQILAQVALELKSRKDIIFEEDLKESFYRVAEKLDLNVDESAYRDALKKLYMEGILWIEWDDFYGEPVVRMIDLNIDPSLGDDMEDLIKESLKGYRSFRKTYVQW